MKNDELRLIGTIENDYTLYFGYREDLIQQLVALSKLPQMIAAVPKDAESRFTSVQAFQQRPADAKSMYWLVKSNELAGVMWFRRKAPPTGLSEKQANYTMAIRIYPDHQGRGLANPFLQLAHADFLKQHTDVHGLWLETSAANAKTRHIYQKFGYQTVAGDDGKVVMFADIGHLS